MTEGKQTRHSDDRRAEELAWIAENRPYLWEHHAGQWIAVQGSELVAFGDDLDAVMDEARRKGVSDPLVTGVRKKEYQGLRLVR